MPVTLRKGQVAPSRGRCREPVEDRLSGNIAARMAQPADDPAHQAVLDELRREAIETYGEERVAEIRMHNALDASANAVWRISQEVLDLQDPEPLPTHD
jgi:hypothetical protein